MDEHPRVTTCRWAVPTLSLPYPLWLQAEDRPWTCTRGPEARALDTTEMCDACPNWVPGLDVTPERPRELPVRR